MFENHHKMSHMDFHILAFAISTSFVIFQYNKNCGESDISGNAVWPKVSGFQKIAKLTIFYDFVHSKCTQCQLRLFL